MLLLQLFLWFHTSFTLNDCRNVIPYVNVKWLYVVLYSMCVKGKVKTHFLMKAAVFFFCSLLTFMFFKSHDHLYTLKVNGTGLSSFKNVKKDVKLVFAQGRYIGQYLSNSTVTNFII